MASQIGQDRTPDCSWLLAMVDFVSPLSLRDDVAADSSVAANNSTHRYKVNDTEENTSNSKSPSHPVATRTGFLSASASRRAGLRALHQAVDQEAGLLHGLGGERPEELANFFEQLLECLGVLVLTRGYKEHVCAFTAAYDGTDLDASTLHVGLSGRFFAVS